jgi:3-oxoacyl-[acyl-carrier protein] reductase
MIGAMDLGLTGKKAFITGGSAGIGLGIAGALPVEGASMAVCGRDRARLDTAVAGLRAAGAEAHGIVADVTDPAALGGAVDLAAERLGGLDLLVANAGGSAGGGLLDAS